MLWMTRYGGQRREPRMDTNKREWDFEKLVGIIRRVHEELAAQAGRAVNISLTLRNWLIGAYISEFELRGSDRAKYGDSLLTVLAKHLTQLNVSKCNRRQLYRYLRFYRLYPEIVGTLSAQLKKLLPAGAIALKKVETASPQLRIPPDKIINRLSYSHMQLIVDLDGDLKRAFYEKRAVLSGQSAYRHPSVHPAGPNAGGICTDQHGQRPFCFQVPA